MRRNVLTKHGTIGGLVALVAATAAVLGATAASGDFERRPTIQVTDYVTGFTPVDRIAPIGLAFGPGGALWASVPFEGKLYKFPPGGGTAAGNALPSNGLGVGLTGLAFGANGALLGARQPTQDVVVVDPDTGSPVRTIATGIPCPLGIAVDPRTKDLFVSSGIGCAQDPGPDGPRPSRAVYRVSDPESATPTTSLYARLPEGPDGITFSPEGTMFLTLERHVASLTGPTNPSPAKLALLAPEPVGDGIVYARNPQGRPFLIINTEDGRLDQVAADGTGELTELARGGSRGDFATVGPDGCMYADQSDRIVKISIPGVACPLDPPPGPASSAVLGTAAENAAALQCSTRRLVLTNVRTRGSRVVLQGVAKPELAGKTVKIRLRATGKQVATAKVRDGGSFSTTAPLPGRSVRTTNSARYQASIANEKSLDLKLRRRMDIDSISSGNGLVRIVGRVSAPYTKPAQTLVLQRRVTCSKTVDVKRIKPKANGVFDVTFAGPPNTQAATYRLMTYVRKGGAKRPKAFPTFTLPRVVSLP